MRKLWLRTTVLMSCLTLTLLPASAAGQTSGFPTISQRSYSGGSIKVTVTGSTKMDADIPINTQASFGDGEMTWLQFGASGSEQPNALITYNSQLKEVGITVGKGKLIMTGGIMEGEKSLCTGKVKVTEKEVVGDYTCAGLTTHDPASGMGKADVKVTFTAKS
jgi:hypothetical protein